MIATSAAPTLGYVAVEDEQTDLDAAMFEAVAIFAAESGLPCLTMADVIAASRQPVSYASAFADLCTMLGMASPAWVAQALS